jgi:hypothetical protein
MFLCTSFLSFEWTEKDRRRDCCNTNLVYLSSTTLQRILECLASG